MERDVAKYMALHSICSCEECGNSGRLLMLMLILYWKWNSFSDPSQERKPLLCCGCKANAGLEASTASSSGFPGENLGTFRFQLVGREPSKHSQQPAESPLSCHHRHAAPQYLQISTLCLERSNRPL